MRVACLLLLLTASAAADPVRLRIATAAPDGTAWAREMRALSRDVLAETHGAVDVRWYFNGIAGGEEEAIARIGKGQLEGVAAGVICTRMAPSLRVLRVPGLFGSWGESLYVMGRLRPRVAAELAHHGFVSLGEGGLGNDIVFSNKQVTTLAELQKGRFAFWDLDDVMRAGLPLIGMQHAVPMRIDEARNAFDRNEIDGIIIMPSPALAFQYSALAKYYSELPLAFMPACLLIASSAFDALSIDDQRIVRAAGAKFQARINDLGREQDQRLLGGLLQHQGVRALHPSELFRSEFFSAAQRGRAQLPAELIPQDLMELTLRWLADYRAENR